jgi:hypothetical protein
MRFERCDPEWTAKFFIAQRFHGCHSGVLQDGILDARCRLFRIDVPETKSRTRSKFCSEAGCFQYAYSDRQPAPSNNDAGVELDCITFEERKAGS